jgi:arsenate reductase-like glutaredoxin family protein
LLDPTTRQFRDAGLAHLILDEAGIVARLRADPRLLKLPLARHGNEVTVGLDEPRWTAWVRPGGAS